MHRILTIAMLALSHLTASAQWAPPDCNLKIDMPGFIDHTSEAARLRATRLVSEADFIAMSRETGTIILDARSKEKFDLLHIRGAVNLSFPDFTEDSLQQLVPDKSTRILIYCNNNFENSELAFPTKAPAAALNLATYVSLYTYGYRNVYELAPLLDPATAALEFESSQESRE